MYVYIHYKEQLNLVLIDSALVAGGGAPETELAVRLTEFCAESAAQANADATKLSGLEQYCVRAFADALEIVPYTLAENAGLNPIATVTDLRKRHADGDVQAGINVRKVHYRTVCALYNV